jgi:hypothetical protein
MDEALRVDDRPQVYYNRGLMLLELGRVNDAVRDLATAVDFDPSLLAGIDGELRDRVAKAVALIDAERPRRTRHR